MIVATFLELALLAVVESSTDLRTRVLGGLLWCGYFYFSASRCALAELAEWLHGRNEPPGGTA
jgi:hypothetical protein